MGFKQGIRALLLSTAVLASVHAPAAVLDNLYQVQLTQEQGQSREAAMRAATVLMLQRLAGAAVDLKREPIARALERPQDLMSRIGTPDAGQLRIQFEPEALGQVLKQADQPLLGPNRPGILLWAVQAGELGDRPLSPMSPSALLLKQAAQHRGVALSFPLGDLQDMSLVTEQLIRDASREPLLKASQRYPAEGTLALVVGGTDERTELDWTLWLNDQHKSGRITGSAVQATDELMQQLAELAFAQYAIPAATAGEHAEWRLQVDGVDGVGAYSGLLGMLRQLGTQQQPRLLEIAGERVVLQISYPGTEQQLERMLGLDMRLQRIAEPVAEPVVAPVAEPELAEGVQEDAVTEDPQVPEELIQPSVPPAPELPTLYFRWRG